ncbi:hypothetical protein D9611_003046 [Ephemerocybe angulata]|uniref:Nephrocystin 3-like N-terminal domain-containing protein n=1 Tax=Ephemerocybe angulata TaxID=980116 RepID=A0A8H5CAU2_9AGAR|nr:hypothetical protein D9611_003046 [Tulosesus angulatus]
MPYPPTRAGAIYSGSAESFLSPPFSVHKPPGFLKTFFQDQYWEEYTNQVIAEANVAEKRARKVKDSNLPLSAEDKAVMDDLIEDIRGRVKDYEVARGSKKPSKAREAVESMHRSTIDLNRVRSTSAYEARQLLAVHSGYTIFSDHKDLNLKPGAYHHIVSCIFALRQPSLERAIAWLEAGYQSKPIHWLCGKKGCGKSVLLNYLAKKCCKEFPLNGGGRIAMISFTEPFDRRSFVHKFLSTLLDQLATNREQLKHILSAIGAGLSERYFFETSLEDQVQDLFIKPLKALQSMLQSFDPVLIFLDGIDLCDAGAADGLFDFIEETLTSLLPVYFIVTSSDERASKTLAQRVTLSPLVDMNEVIPFPDAIQEGLKSGILSSVSDWPVGQSRSEKAGSDTRTTSTFVDPEK